MSASHLVVFPAPGEPESPADRIRRLQAEARCLAREHIEQLVAALGEVARLAAEVADGGDLYPVGVRELSRRLVEDAGKHALSLGVIVDRA
ncbi:MAG: hypothetical protein ACREEW_04885 [Caulobacteraceae bacterium]